TPGSVDVIEQGCTKGAGPAARSSTRRTSVTPRAAPGPRPAPVPGMGYGPRAVPEPGAGRREPPGPAARTGGRSVVRAGDASSTVPGSCFWHDALAWGSTVLPHPPVLRRGLW